MLALGVVPCSGGYAFVLLQKMEICVAAQPLSMDARVANGIFLLKIHRRVFWGNISLADNLPPRLLISLIQTDTWLVDSRDFQNA